MRNFCVIGQVDVSKVLAGLNEHPDLWNENPDRLVGFNMVAPADFDDIWVHMPSSVSGMSRDEVMANLAVASHGTRWHRAFYELELKPILYHILAAVDGEAFGRVFISRLKPGKAIFPHEDQDLEAFARFHVCLQNAPGAIFKCGEDVAEPRAGDVFWFDNGTTHSVENNSDTDRLTMVVDIVTPVREILLSRSWVTK